MQVKVYCACGSKFAFDVEPVAGRMPVAIACPNCGQDATDLANERIREQLATEPESVPVARPVPSASTRIHIQLPRPAAEPPAPEAPRLALRREAAPPPTDAPAGAAICTKHMGQPIIDSCRVCGKPICAECMAMFGYVCSGFCKNKAEAGGINLPVYARQRSVIQRRARNRGRAILAGAVVLVLLLIASGVYYKAYASKPRVVHTQPIAGGGDFERAICKLLDDDAYLSIVGSRMSLHDVKSGMPRWTVSLDEKASDDDESFSFGGAARLLDHRQDLWVQSGNRLLCYDRADGTRKHRVALPGSVLEELADDEFITVLSVERGGLDTPKRILTRVALADGEVTTHPIVLPEAQPAKTAERRPTRESSAADEVSSSFIVTGPNVVEMQVRLIERRQIQREAIKRPRESIMDRGAVSGANAMQAAEELLNEITRTTAGGVEIEDASRYEVTLHRHPADSAPVWTNEVVGQISFYPMRTMDLLVAGKSLRVFDKQNRLRWEAPLTFAVDPEFGSRFGERRAPALESADTLYFFDQGMLTAFDSTSGTPRWRVTSVGIHQVQEDTRGHLYVSTTTAGAEDIQYSKQVKIIDALEPVLMKVDAATGEVLWKTTQAGQQCFLSGDYVYATKSTIDLSIAIDPENTDTHFRVLRIDPKNGERLWTYYQPQEAQACDFRNNMFLLQFTDCIQLLKYLSL